MNSIEQDIRLHRKNSALPSATTLRIQSKFDDLRDTYGIHFDPTILTISSCPALYSQLNSLPELKRFFRRTIDIWVEEKGCENIVYSQFKSKWTRLARLDDRIALFNPHTEIVESWSRIFSASKFRKDHYLSNRKKSKKKSTFNGNYDFIWQIEQAAFRKGIGLLVSANLIRLYIGYTNPIGQSRLKRDQNYVCLECERISRSQHTTGKGKKKQYGYKVIVHGYPVEVSDIQLDIASTPLKIGDIPILKN